MEELLKKKTVAVLFARADSVYKDYSFCDVYDIERDALTFKGDLPIVAHPPCRAWGRLRMQAKPREGEKELAIWAIQQIRNNGGVLEHPECSLLWEVMELPLGRDIDKFGGFSLSVDQFWWGHKARKKTWLYILGIQPDEIPDFQIRYEAITHVVCSTKKGYKKELSKAARESTPKKFAEWLIDIALKTKVNNHGRIT